MSWKNSLALTGPSFNPTDIQGLQNWWHAGFENTVTLSGSKVSEWRDLLRGVPATQSIAGLRPEYVRNAVNGKNAIHFNSSDLAVSVANRPAAATHTIIAAIRATGDIPGGGSPYSLSGIASFHGNGLWFAASPNGYILGSFVFDRATATFGHTNARNTVVLYKNGAAVGTGRADGAVSTTAGLCIGRRLGLQFFTGYICELLYYTRDLTRPEMARLQEYFDQGWQITSGGTAARVVGSPLDISGCQLWLDGRDLSSLKQNADGTGAVSRIGDPIGYWGNKGSQSSWNATESLAARKPVLAEGGPGLRGLLFSGNQRLTISSLNAGSRVTAVAAFIPYSTNPQFGRVFDTGSRQALFLTSSGFFAGNQSQSFALSGSRGFNPTVSAIRFDTSQSLSLINGAASPLGDLAANTFSGGMSIGWSNGLGDASTNAFFGGMICELAVYDRALSLEEMQALTRYLQTVWGGGIIKPVSGHPEAQAWIDRVYLNGGFVSQYTADRVADFCYKVDQAGLRDRFHRLSLFCGGNLQACLTPLYLGPSKTIRTSGTVYDTSTSFTASDYIELGGSGGLKGDGTSKSLESGFLTTALTAMAPNIHLSYYCNQLPTTTTGTFIYTGTSTQRVYGLSVEQGGFFRTAIGGVNGSGLPLSAQRGQRLASRDSTGMFVYQNGQQIAQSLGDPSPNEYPNQTSQTIRLFASRVDNNSAADRTNARIQGYSLGTNLTATQAQNYAAIMEGFQRSLGRGIDIYQVAFAEITHPDARDWLSRVHNNGGVVDSTTAGYVQDVCNAVDAAGLRDRFYRLNLFCGSNLAACLTPLYRGPSLSGTQYGGEIDVNSSFAAADFTNTGGLRSTTTTKTISTNVLVNSLPQAQNSHLALSIMPNSIVTGARCFGVGLSNQTFMWYAECYTGARNITGAASSSSQSIAATNVNAYARWCFSRTSNTSHVLYQNGQSVASNSAAIAARTAPAAGHTGWAVSGGLGFGTAAMGLNYYSFGDGFTSQQAAGFDDIMKQFLHATGRVPLPPSSVLAAVSNADAVDWAHRVYANGGTLSETTAAAVNTFCNAVNAAGIRNLFYRLNLLCGGNLAACLTPLYYGTTATSFQYGDVIDTATNFVASDYVETGSSGGLQGNTTSKSLETGLLTSSLVSALPSNHLAIYGNNTPTAGRFINLGDGDNTKNYTLLSFDSGTQFVHSINGLTSTAGVAESIASRLGMRLISRTASNLQTLYRNGVEGGQNATATSGAAWSGQTARLFASRIQNNSADSWSNVRACGYSMGLGMTAQQAADYYAAMQAFQVALGRQA